MIAVIPVRDGVLPAGTDDAIAECDGNVLFAGSGLDALTLAGRAVTVTIIDLGVFEVGRWARQLAAVLGDDESGIVLPHCPDGRDLAPALSLLLDRHLFSGATEISDGTISVARRGGRQLHRHVTGGAFVATLQPGIRGADSFDGDPVVTTLTATIAHATPTASSPHQSSDAHVVDVLPPDVRTMDLSEARRIVGGGAGLDSEQRFGQLAEFAAGIGATMGATRVITDRAWVHHDKQIGTTGVVVDPDLYVSFGVSGAVQHTAGLGSPRHIISVNTDPHCPMMQMSDLAIVADANATLDEVMRLLDERAGQPAEAETRETA